MNAPAKGAGQVGFEPIKPHIGSIVHVDKAHLLDEGVVSAIRLALEERGVLVFPGINLTDEEQLAFTDAFGQRLNYTSGARQADGESAGEDDVYRIVLGKGSSLAPEMVLATWFWHIDGALVDQPLPKATMLSARKLSPTGGQTEFANTVAAYEALPEALKREIAGLKVIHRLGASMRLVFKDGNYVREGAAQQVPAMVHPLVWPQYDGRKSLVLGSHADEIVGQSIPAGRSLLARLTEWVSQPQFTLTHEWSVGDFVIWNNWGVLHRVVPYEDDSGRDMHRTSIQGDKYLGAPLAA